MELVFNQAEKMWVAEFEAAADFNLHIERSSGGNILLYQRTQGGGWDIVDDFSAVRWQGVIDYDCTALIYPKYLKIVSESRPDYAAVISTGEVAEVKSQSKEIEVTSNGTTEVTPDSGFAYLNSVKVKTNVEQSGGNGGGEGSASSMEYLVLSAADNVKSVVTMFSAFARVYVDGMVAVLPTYVFAAEGEIGLGKYPYAVAIDFSAKIISGEPMTIKDLIILNGITADQLAAIPRITEAEFYNLDIPELQE